jgi:hypothetical protein
VDYASAISYGTPGVSHHSLSFYSHHFNQSMTDGIEVSFQPSMDETDKKVLIGLAVEMRVPVFLFYKVSALILQVLPLAV